MNNKRTCKLGDRNDAKMNMKVMEADASTQSAQ